MVTSALIGLITLLPFWDDVAGAGSESFQQYVTACRYLVRLVLLEWLGVRARPTHE